LIDVAQVRQGHGEVREHPSVEVVTAPHPDLYEAAVVKGNFFGGV
jgi:hypothetical protein